MAVSSLLLVLLTVVMVTRVMVSAGENELDYGYWNYREGVDRVNVASVRSVTRVLDVWGKRIFNEIKTLLHSQPAALLPDYSRVRPLSESVNDLFREVSLLHRRITELTRRLATLEPFLRHHGYRERGEEGAEDHQALVSRKMTGEGGRRDKGTQASRVVRRRRVRIINHGGVRVIQSER